VNYLFPFLDILSAYKFDRESKKHRYQAVKQKEQPKLKRQDYNMK